MDRKIKLGIIGIGNMGSAHAGNIVSGKCPDFELVAVADINKNRIEWAKNNISPEIKFRYRHYYLFSQLPA